MRKKNRSGQVLIASPQMPDKSFLRLVIALVKDEDDGAMGLCLNRPTGQTVSEVWSSLPEEQRQNVTCDNKDPIFAGGPVFGPLIAIHTEKKWSEEKICEDVFMSSDGDQLTKIIKKVVN